MSVIAGDIFLYVKRLTLRFFSCHSNKDDAATLMILAINSATALKKACNFLKKRLFKKLNILLHVTKENNILTFMNPKYILTVIESHNTESSHQSFFFFFT